MKKGQVEKKGLTKFVRLAAEVEYHKSADIF